MVQMTDKQYVKLSNMAEYQVPHKPKWYIGDCKDGHFVYNAFCPRCESELAEDDNFCPVCGQGIDWNIDREDEILC